jgi:hypothetical protein
MIVGEQGDPYCISVCGIGMLFGSTGHGQEFGRSQHAIDAIGAAVHLQL